MSLRGISLYRRFNGVYDVKVLDCGRMTCRYTGAVTRTEALAAVSRLEEILKPRLPDALLQQFACDFLTPIGRTCAGRACVISGCLLDWEPFRC